MGEPKHSVNCNQPSTSFVNQQDSPILAAKVVAIECVFEYLNLSDICSIGQTCKKLHFISGNYFEEKYPSQELTIYKTFRNDIIQEINHSITNFASFAHRLLVYIRSERELLYVAKNVNKKLEAIILCVNSKCNLNLESIKAILKKVEYFEIRNEISTISPSNLTFCKNLKYLNLCVSNLQLLYNHQYPTLETLEINFNYVKSNEKLIKFLKLNRQIKRFSMKNLDTNFMLNIVEAAQPNLDLLSIYTYRNETVDISERLNRCHESGYFKRFSFSGNWSSFLMDIAKVPSLVDLFIGYDNEIGLD